MQYTLFYSSNKYSADTSVELVGGFQPTIDVSVPYKKVVSATISMGASKESPLCASNES